MTQTVSLPFEAYADMMMPWVERIINRRQWPGHPFMSKDDLLQEALFALFQVYKSRTKRMSVKSLCLVGTHAVFCRMLDVFRQSSNGGEIPGKTIVHIREDRLGAVINNGNGTFRETDALERVLLRVAIERVMDQEDDEGRALLSEMMNPDVGTVRSMRRRERVKWSFQPAVFAASAAAGLPRQRGTVVFARLRGSVFEAVGYNNLKAKKNKGGRRK